MSDKYQYIDRPETLNAKLSKLMGEMTSGEGLCSLKISLPKNYSLLGKKTLLLNKIKVSS